MTSLAGIPLFKIITNMKQLTIACTKLYRVMYASAIAVNLGACSLAISSSSRLDTSIAKDSAFKAAVNTMKTDMAAVKPVAMRGTTVLAMVAVVVMLCLIVSVKINAECNLWGSVSLDTYCERISSKTAQKTA